jgi:hypothetical protein
MSRDRINHVAAQWVRLGAMFNTSAAGRDVDVERLLLETARAAAANSRLFILAVTWLAQYGEYIAKHRLARLIRHELEAEHRPTMGLMLDMARQKGGANRLRFNQAIEACGEAVDQRPLLAIDQRNNFFIHAARQNASALSIKWGRWMADFDLKGNAIRPASWIVQNNPKLQWRADFKGDLRASILAELDANPDSGDSESELARACGATRAAIGAAVGKLELSGRVSRRREGKRVRAGQKRRK